MLFIRLIHFAAAATAQHQFSTGSFNGILNGESGVLQSLKPVSESSFDFSPSDYFSLRNGVGNYHTGDITARWRVQGQSAWDEIDTAASRNINPVTSNKTGSILHSSFNNVFPAAAKYFSITRDWKIVENDVILQATIVNGKTSTVEVGSFGFPIEFDNIFTNRTAEQTHNICSLVDPYIGLDAGYAQVTRLTGTGPNLAITPYGNSSKFEAWRFLFENPNQPTYYQSQTFEGLYAWEILSKAYAENEWNNTQPWNPPTSVILKPGQSVSFALRFGLASDIYGIEDTVASKGVPVAVGIPGYVLPSDTPGQLFVNAPSAVQSISVEPQGALTLTSQATKNVTWKGYQVKPATGSYGRARITLGYKDGREQTVHYYITDPSLTAASKVGNFLTTNQWFANTSDPFGRAPSVISYDHDVGQMILQEPRAWIAGISDEGGACSFEAAGMKSSVHPVASEVQKLEEMVNSTVWGVLQDKTTDQFGGQEYAVKRSVFFYQPSVVPNYQYDPSIDWNVWSAWDQSDAWSIWRAYDYVHVSALYWGLYSANRASPGILTLQKPTWYLMQAYHTVMASQATKNGQAITSYADVGLMGETVWMSILQALRAENMTSEFSTMQTAMKQRQSIWASQALPYGSEMAWDCTGQEGVYLWSKYFNDTASVEKTLASIRGYDPTVAHWGWNGNARRYWDFLYAGKLERYERMIHHYGSGLNALPLLEAYKYNTDPSSPSAIHDLRVAYGGLTGPTSNIHQDGFAAIAFHSWPTTMAWDGYSGDWGLNFLGHVEGACTYLVDHPDFGMINFGGIQMSGYGNSITVQPRDTVRRRIYIAPMGLRMEIDAGVIPQFTYNPAARTVNVQLAQAPGELAKSATMTFEDTLSTGVHLTSKKLPQTLGGYTVSFPSTLTFSM